MVLGDTKGFQIQVQEIGSVYFVVVLDSSVGAVRAAFELIPHVFDRYTFPSMYILILRSRKRMHVSETIQAVIGKALQSPHALQMNWFKGTIPAEMLCGVHPCRHHVRNQNTLAQEAQTGTCHQEVPIMTIVPTLADLQ